VVLWILRWPGKPGVTGYRRHRQLSRSYPPPDVLKPARRKRGVVRRRIDGAVAQIGLQRSRIEPLVRQCVAAGMPKHVRVDLEP
jgi:hypothetical protein